MRLFLIGLLLSTFIGSRSNAQAMEEPLECTDLAAYLCSETNLRNSAFQQATIESMNLVLLALDLAAKEIGYANFREVQLEQFDKSNLRARRNFSYQAVGEVIARNSIFFPDDDTLNHFHTSDLKNPVLEEFFVDLKNDSDRILAIEELNKMRTNIFFLLSSKPSIDLIFARFLSYENTKNFEIFFGEMKTEVEQALRGIFQNIVSSGNEGAIKKSLEGIKGISLIFDSKRRAKLSYADDAKAQFSIGGHPIRTIDRSSFDSMTKGELLEMSYGSLSRPGGRYFGVVEGGGREYAWLSSFIYLLAAKDSNAVLPVVAHEISHHFGLEITKTNGYDLSDTYQSLTSCLISEEIPKKMDTNMDEILADWFAAEVIGQKILKLNKMEQKAALFSTLALTCGSEKQSSISAKKQVARDTRINVMYGANPTIRKVLGCRQPPPKRYCPLK